MIPAYDQIPAMRDAGLCLKQIAHKLGVSHSRASFRARRLGVEFNSRLGERILAALRWQRQSSVALAQRLDAKLGVVRARLSQLRREGRVEKCGHERHGTRWVAVWRIVR